MAVLCIMQFTTTKDQVGKVQIILDCEETFWYRSAKEAANRGDRITAERFVRAGTDMCFQDCEAFVESEWPRYAS